MSRLVQLLSIITLLTAQPGCRSNCEKLHDKKVELVEGLDVPAGDEAAQQSKTKLLESLSSTEGREASIHACAQLKPEAVSCALNALDLKALDACRQKATTDKEVKR